MKKKYVILGIIALSLFALAFFAVTVYKKNRFEDVSPKYDSEHFESF